MNMVDYWKLMHNLIHNIGILCYSRQKMKGVDQRVAIFMENLLLSRLKGIHKISKPNKGNEFQFVVARILCVFGCFMQLWILYDANHLRCCEILRKKWVGICIRNLDRERSWSVLEISGWMLYVKKNLIWKYNCSFFLFYGPLIILIAVERLIIL